VLYKGYAAPSIEIEATEDEQTMPLENDTNVAETFGFSKPKQKLTSRAQTQGSILLPTLKSRQRSQHGSSSSVCSARSAFSHVMNKSSRESSNSHSAMSDDISSNEMEEEKEFAKPEKLKRAGTDPTILDKFSVKEEPKFSFV